jgi:plastocyanin
MRRTGLATALAAAFAAVLSVAPAFAADQTVTANTTFPNGLEKDFFKPETVSILIGDTVHWHNNAGKHNVHLGFNDRKIGGDPVTHSSSATHWDAQWTFTKAGTFKYWCDEHSDGSFGMIGKVVVSDPNAPAPTVTNLTAKPASFCTNRSQTCDRRGTKVKFRLSAAARVTGQIKPKGTSKPFVQIFQKQRPAGKSSIDYSGKGLKPGKYVLRVHAGGANGKQSPWAKTAVKVVKNG